MDLTTLSIILFISGCFQLAFYLELTRNHAGQRSPVFLLFLFALGVPTTYVGFLLLDGWFSVSDVNEIFGNAGGLASIFGLIMMTWPYDVIAVGISILCLAAAEYFQRGLLLRFYNWINKKRGKPIIIESSGLEVDAHKLKSDLDSDKKPDRGGQEALNEKQAALKNEDEDEDEDAKTKHTHSKPQISEYFWPGVIGLFLLFLVLKNIPWVIVHLILALLLFATHLTAWAIYEIFVVPLEQKFKEKKGWQKNIFNVLAMLITGSVFIFLFLLPLIYFLVPVKELVCSFSSSSCIGMSTNNVVVLLISFVAFAGAYNSRERLKLVYESDRPASKVLKSFFVFVFVYLFALTLNVAMAAINKDSDYLQCEPFIGLEKLWELTSPHRYWTLQSYNLKNGLENSFQMDNRCMRTDSGNYTEICAPQARLQEQFNRACQRPEGIKEDYSNYCVEFVEREWPENKVMRCISYSNAKYKNSIKERFAR